MQRFSELLVFAAADAPDIYVLKGILIKTFSEFCYFDDKLRLNALLPVQPSEWSLTNMCNILLQGMLK